MHSAMIKKRCEQSSIMCVYYLKSPPLISILCQGYEWVEPYLFSSPYMPAWCGGENFDLFT